MAKKSAPRGCLTAQLCPQQESPKPEAQSGCTILQEQPCACAAECRGRERGQVSDALRLAAARVNGVDLDEVPLLVVRPEHLRVWPSA